MARARLCCCVARSARRPRASAWTSRGRGSQRVAGGWVEERLASVTSQKASLSSTKNHSCPPAWNHSCLRIASASCDAAPGLGGESGDVAVRGSGGRWRRTPGGRAPGAPTPQWAVAGASRAAPGCGLCAVGLVEERRVLGRGCCYRESEATPKDNQKFLLKPYSQSTHQPHHSRLSALARRGHAPRPRRCVYLNSYSKACVVCYT